MEQSIKDYFSKLGKKGGNKTKLKGKKYFSDIGKLGAKKRWNKLLGRYNLGV